MSCDDMKCRDAMEQLWALIDHELDDAAAAQIHAHLDACQHCYPQYDFHRAYREFISARCRQSAPPALRRRVFMSLLAAESSGDT